MICTLHKLKISHISRSICLDVNLELLFLFWWIFWEKVADITTPLLNYWTTYHWRKRLSHAVTELLNLGNVTLIIVTGCVLWEADAETESWLYKNERKRQTWTAEAVGSLLLCLPVPGADLESGWFIGGVLCWVEIAWPVLLPFSVMGWGCPENSETLLKMNPDCGQTNYWGLSVSHPPLTRQ